MLFQTMGASHGSESRPSYKIEGHSFMIEVKSPQVCSFCCRFCGEPLSRSVVDLGMSPLCESYLQR